MKKTMFFILMLSPLFFIKCSVETAPVKPEPEPAPMHELFPLAPEPPVALAEATKPHAYLWTAEWCGPCKLWHEALPELRKHFDITIYDITTDEAEAKNPSPTGAVPYFVFKNRDGQWRKATKGPKELLKEWTSGR